MGTDAITIVLLVVALLILAYWENLTSAYHEFKDYLLSKIKQWDIPFITLRDWVLVMLALPVTWMVGTMIQGNFSGFVAAALLFFFLLWVIAQIDKAKAKREKEDRAQFQQQLTTNLTSAIKEVVKEALRENREEREHSDSTQSKPPTPQ